MIEERTDYTKRFTHKDITVPDGWTIEDMDWSLLSWDLVCPDGYGRSTRFAQLLFAPGILIFREGVLNDTTFTDEDTAMMYSRGTSLMDMESLCDVAVAKTERLMRESGYTMNHPPFVVDFSEPSLRAFIKETTEVTSFSVVNSIGDALIENHGAAMKKIFSHVAATRRATGLLGW